MVSPVGERSPWQRQSTQPANVTTLGLLRCVPGRGKILSLVVLPEIYDIDDIDR
jgi:hypothetical protein